MPVLNTRVEGEFKPLRDGILVRNMDFGEQRTACLLYTSPSPRDATLSRMPSSA